jgi:hypothetical protein
MNKQIGSCAECKKKRLLLMGRCRECRKAFARKAFDAEPAGGFVSHTLKTKLPNIERFENCVLEIDRGLGRILVHLPTGKTKVKVSRIPLGRLMRELIDI